MKSEHLCVQCRFFAPASTCVEKPTWGYCNRLKGHGPPETADRPRLAWADQLCDHYEPRNGVRVAGS